MIGGLGLKKIRTQKSIIMKRSDELGISRNRVQPVEISVNKETSEIIFHFISSN